MKIISMYLPQFHTIKENNEWWGKGFTEWVTVRQAKRFSPNHFQPRVPLNNNYYNLLEKDTMRWQANLMEQYGIDGQCFYHYYFKDGRKILEKPAENLLKWKDIYMPFCFCWANETWARTWSKLRDKNSWAYTFEKKKEPIDSGILLEQQYGNEKDWRIHYDYLKKFFIDDRYIKYEGKPLFLIYQTHLITCLGDMLNCWNRWAIEDGWKGIYVIGANTNISVEKYLDGILYHEPQRSISLQDKKTINGVNTYQYKDLWEALLSTENFGKKTYYGGFVGYDDTPRRGGYGAIVEGESPELFQNYLCQLIAKNSLAGNEYIFLNAWNEWGEGMYLEPDEKDKYLYLEAVKYARGHYVDYMEKYKEHEKNLRLSMNRELDVFRRKAFKYEKYWKVLDAWMKLREQRKNVESYLKEHQIKKIGIYGVGMMGQHLISELSESEVEIVYGIDQKAEFIDASIPVYKPEAPFPLVDAIIITTLFDVEIIKSRIAPKITCRIVLLDEIIMNMIENKAEF